MRSGERDARKTVRNGEASWSHLGTRFLFAYTFVRDARGTRERTSGGVDQNSGQMGAKAIAFGAGFQRGGTSPMIRDESD